NEGNGFDHDAVCESFEGPLYVAASAPPDGDGMSWGSALAHPAHVEGVAVVGTEVWVTAGTYRAAAAERVVLEPIEGRRYPGGFVGDEGVLADRPRPRPEIGSAHV